MKTIWHWKNIGKTFLLVILAGLLVAQLPLSETIGFFVGMAAGGIAVFFGISKWGLWHFE